jgi:hypothetical protein
MNTLRAAREHVDDAHPALFSLSLMTASFLGKLIKLMPTLSDKKRAVTIAHESNLKSRAISLPSL